MDHELAKLKMQNLHPAEMNEPTLPALRNDRALPTLMALASELMERKDRAEPMHSSEKVEHSERKEKAVSLGVCEPGAVSPLLASSADSRSMGIHGRVEMSAMQARGAHNLRDACPLV